MKTVSSQVKDFAAPAPQESFFADLGYSQCCKDGEEICGDAFKFRKSADDERVIAVLSDGLGSGVKANILASMTASMALKFAAESEDNIIHSAEIMMSALPICQVRKISYATFTIVNVGLHGSVRIIEMGNPAFLFYHGNELREVPFRELESKRWENRRMKIYHFDMSVNSRVIFFSDGISQAGMGSEKLPLGWRENGCAEFVTGVLADRPDISSHEISELVLREAKRKEPGLVNKDDMTCASLYLRHPREMLLFTGPPYDPKHDSECAQAIANFHGDTVISGGTSAEIVARELKRELKMDLKNVSPDMPPQSFMEGVSLVTEGIFTLSRTAQYLENFDGVHRPDPAGRLTEIMLRNDIINVLVGTRINEAHQDPNLPLDLEFRRNIVTRIAKILETNFLKKVNIRYV